VQKRSETQTERPTTAAATSLAAKMEPEEEVLIGRFDLPVDCPHGAYCPSSNDVKLNSNAELGDDMRLIDTAEGAAVGRLGSTNWKPGQPLTVCVFCSTEGRSCEYENPEALANHLRRFHAAATSFELCAYSRMYKFFICPNMDCTEPFHPSQTRLNFHNKSHARVKTPSGTEPEALVEVDYSQVAASALLNVEYWENAIGSAYSSTPAAGSMIPLIPSAAEYGTAPISEIRERWNAIFREKISTSVILNAKSVSDTKRSSVSDMNFADGGADSIFVAVKRETDAL